MTKMSKPTQPGRLEGLIEAAEGRVLQGLAKASRYNVVEIGSHKGKSTAYLARGAQENKHRPVVCAVDVWRRFAEYYPEKASSIFNDPTIFDTWEDQMVRAGVRESVWPLEMSSADAREEFGDDDTIGVLFIDAAHDYENAMRDFALWSPLVVSGGIVAFHDYGNPRWPHGVTRVVNEELRDSGSYTDFNTMGTLAWATKK